MAHQNPGLAWAVGLPSTQKPPVQTQMVPFPHSSGFEYLIASASHFSHHRGESPQGLFCPQIRRRKA